MRRKPIFRMPLLLTARLVVPAWMVLASVALSLGCADHGSMPHEPRLNQPRLSAAAVGNHDASAWSEPEHLGPVVNSEFQEQGGGLSPDALSLYFNSTRPNPHCLVGPCDHDIWVSRRDCPECAWEAPVNLGPNINSPESDGAPAISPDGHLLFFSSTRAGGQGGDDLWVSWRSNNMDDLGWTPPVNLGPDLNTVDSERSPAFLPGRGEEGGHTLYFVRASTTVRSNIYQATVKRDGRVVGPAMPVTELNHSSLPDDEPTIRGDGRELIFWSTRPGGEGDVDLWVATRCNSRDPWSTPQTVGPPVNTSFGGELSPGLSRDGRTLVFSGNMQRGGSLGRQDLWMSTRTRVEHGHECDDK